MTHTTQTAFTAQADQEAIALAADLANDGFVAQADQEAIALAADLANDGYNQEVIDMVNDDDFWAKLYA